MNRMIYSLGLVLFYLSCPAQKPVLLSNFSLIDASGKNLQEHMSLLMAADTIHSVFEADAALPFSDVERVDLSGKFLLPGLIDAHTHLATNPSGRDSLGMVRQKLDILLRRGVTTVRDMSGDARLLAYLARQTRLDEINGPDIYYAALMAGPRFFVRDRRASAATAGAVAGNTPWIKAVDGETDIRIAVAEARGSGASGIKLYANLDANLSKALAQEARRQGLGVWAHAAILPGKPSDMVNAGVEVLSHGLLLALEQLITPVEGQRPRIDTVLTANAPKLQALVSTMAAQQVFLDPTLTVYRGRRPAALFNNSVLATQMAYKAGVPLVAGTDRPVPTTMLEPMALIEELETMVDQVGMSPLEAIQAATRNAAMMLRIDGQVGTVAKGKKANLLIVNSNPLEGINNLNAVFRVYKNGRQVN